MLKPGRHPLIDVVAFDLNEQPAARSQEPSAAAQQRVGEATDADVAVSEQGGRPSPLAG
jgi:hypothetical protein